MAQLVAEEIHRRILGGAYAPGSFIPTERDLAHEFGASRPTISKALDSLRDVGLIEQTPGRGTRVLLVSERTGTGAIAIVNLDRPPYAPERACLLQGAHEALGRRNQHYESLPTGAGPSEITADALTARFAGALFVEAAYLEKVIAELDRRKFPCVVANLESDIEATATYVDHGRAIRTAVRMLATLGHRRIALISRPPVGVYCDVMAGFKQALADVGLPFSEDLVTISETRDSVGGYLQTREFLRRKPKATGLVAARDYLANGACRALEEAGLRIGYDVSVIGFDDVSWPLETPFLTTVREPTLVLGSTAAEMLIERIISGWRPAEKVEIEAPLVLRRSAGPAPEFHVEGRVPPLLLRSDCGAMSVPPH